MISFTSQSWRYYEAGNQPADNNGVDWKASTYDDSAWKSGFGFFAYEPDTPGNYAPINTALTLSNAGASEITRTFYFRTHFSFPGDPTNVFLYFTNVVDDGCVVYLNGSRLYNVRVPQANPAYADLASGGPAAEGTRELVTVFNSPSLRQGDNVLAAEIKQGTTLNSDVAWNLALAYSRPEAVVITKQPPDSLALVEFDDPLLSVEATGTDRRYWWFRNNVFLNGQTNSTLRLTNVTVAQAGTYHVLVSNAVNSVRSSNAVITVVPDTFGPRIRDVWVPLGSPNRILIQFNEDILRFPGVGNTNRSGANLGNYWITVMGQTNRVVITQAVVGIGVAQVRLTADRNFDPAVNYQICVSNICDVRTNAIAWNSCVPVGFETVTNPIVYQDMWAYHEWDFAPEGGDWKATDFFEDPTRWVLAPAMFSTTAFTPNVGCTFPNWIMSVGYCTYYFRKSFVIPPNLAGVRMSAVLDHVLDDGAVFYLNGVELLRYNLRAGDLDRCTATSAQGDPACRSNAISGLVLSRTNTLAVELHQFAPGSPNDIDAAFDARLTLNYIRYPSFPQPADVQVFATNHSATEVSVYFTNGFGYAIQAKTNLADPWREMQPITNRLITPKSNPHRFFRLEKSH